MSMASSCLQVASTSGGYHQSIYSCLTALKDGELGLLQSSLVEARSVTVMSFALAGVVREKLGSGAWEQG